MSPQKPRWREKSKSSEKHPSTERDEFGGGSDVSPLNLAARVVVAAGVAIAVMALVVRGAIRSPQSMAADTTAIVLGVVLVVAGLVAIRIDVVRQRKRAAEDEGWG